MITALLGEHRRSIGGRPPAAAGRADADRLKSHVLVPVSTKLTPGAKLTLAPLLFSEPRTAAMKAMNIHIAQHLLRVDSSRLPLMGGTLEAERLVHASSILCRMSGFVLLASSHAAARGSVTPERPKPPLTSAPRNVRRGPNTAAALQEVDAEHLTAISLQASCGAGARGVRPGSRLCKEPIKCRMTARTRV